MIWRHVGILSPTLIRLRGGRANDDDGRQTPKESLQFSESITLDVVDCVKLLGVDIDKKLTFSSHIGRICKKAGKHCYVLRRLSNVRTSEASWCYLNATS